MKTSPRPPHPSQRVLAVLASILQGRDEPGSLGAAEVDEDAIKAATGYSRRSLERVWQELAAAGAATVHPLPRCSGMRTVDSHPHEWWAWAALEVTLQDAS